MDKAIETITYSPQTIAKETKAIGYKLSAMVFSLLVLFPVAGYAATQTSDDATGTPSELSAVLKRLVEAGKKVSSRALSSQAKATSTKTAPVATGTAGKAPAITASVKEKAAAKEVAAVPAKAASKAQKGVVDMGGAKASNIGSPKKYAFEYPDQPVIDEKMEPVKKKIEGEIGAVIKMGMNVEFDRNDRTASSKDLWVNFAKGMKLEGVNGFGDFHSGDKVQVLYTESKDGSRRVIESIKLLKAKTDKERQKEALAAASEARVEEVMENAMSSKEGQ